MSATYPVSSTPCRCPYSRQVASGARPTHRTGTSCPAARTNTHEAVAGAGIRAELRRVDTVGNDRASRSRHQGLQLRAILVRNRHVECAGLAPAPLLALHETRLKGEVRATPAP